MEKIFEIALVYSPNEWVEALHRHCTNTGTLRIRALVYDSTVLQTEEFDAVVISDSHPALNSGLIHNLHGREKIVVGVCDEESNARSFLAEAGIDAIFNSRQSAESLCREIVDFLEQIRDGRDAQPDDTNILERINQETIKGLHKTSKTITVIGTGGSGATELSLVLASRLIDSVLVDADFEHPSIAPRTGLFLEPHLISAIEASINEREKIGSTTQRLRSNAAIVGVCHSSYSRDIQNYELEALNSGLYDLYTNIVFDLGRVTEDSNFYARQQFILESSDVILITGEATPVGILRVLELVSMLFSISKETGARFSTLVAINRCKKDKRSTSEIRNELEDISQVDSVFTFLESSEFHDNSWNCNVSQPKVWKKEMDLLLKTISELPQQQSDIEQNSISTKSSQLIETGVSA